MPDNINKFIGYMEQVHSFGSSIPNPIKYLVANSSLRQSNLYFKDRGYLTNTSLYLCGSDLEMIIVQLIAIPVVAKLSERFR